MTSIVTVVYLPGIFLRTLMDTNTLWHVILRRVVTSSHSKWLRWEKNEPKKGHAAGDGFTIHFKFVCSTNHRRMGPLARLTGAHRNVHWTCARPPKWHHCAWHPKKFGWKWWSSRLRRISAVQKILEFVYVEGSYHLSHPIVLGMHIHE